MKKMVLSLMLSCIGMSALANQSVVSDATLDQIITRLEKTGKLDKALERVIDKRVKTEKENQAKLALEQEKRNQENAKLIPTLRKEDHVLGNRDARYSMIVYEDLECPFCKIFADVPEKAIKEIKDLNFISRANPLPFHMPVAAKEAVLAECVAKELGDKGYFDFTRKVFKTTLTNGQGLPEIKEVLNIGLMEENALINSFKKDEKSLFAIAKEVGVKDIRSVFDCYRDKDTSVKIQNLLTESNKYGINGTPTTVLKDNKTGRSKMIAGVLPEDAFIQEVNNFIEQSQ